MKKLRMGKNIKAQIRMSETIAVLFIFFVLVVFGIIFYYKYSTIAFEQEQEERLGLKGEEITLKTLFLPEIICSKGAAEAEGNCFDVLKLEKAKEVLEKNMNDYYFNLFPYSVINITQLYPELEDGEGEWLLYNRPKPDYERKETAFFVVTLKDERKGLLDEGEYAFGYLTVEVYS